MPRNKFIPTTGITIWYGDAANAVDTQLAGIKDISKASSATVKKFKVTRVDQVDDEDEIDKWEQQAMGRRMPGSVELKFGGDEDTIVEVESLIGEEKYYEVRYPTGAKRAFLGAIEEVGDDTPEDDEVVFPVKIAILTRPVFTAAPPPG